MKPLSVISIIWHKNRLFCYMLAPLLIIGAFPLVLLDQMDFFIWLKQWHHPVADGVAPYLTWLGDGLTYVGLLGMVTLWRASCRNLMIMGGGGMFIVVQLLKRVFCRHMLRPIALLPMDTFIHSIDDVPLSRDFSCPSGHAATIFLLISVVQLLSNSKNKIYTFLLVGLALMVAYSRIYLCAHFYTDVYIGAWIGVLSAVLVYMRFIHLKGPFWLDRSLYGLVINKWNKRGH